MLEDAENLTDNVEIAEYNINAKYRTYEGISQGVSCRVLVWPEC